MDGIRSMDQDILSQKERHDFLIEKATTEISELSGDDKSIVHHIARSISDVIYSPTAQAQVIGVAKYLSIRLLIKYSPEWL